MDFIGQLGENKQWGTYVGGTNTFPIAFPTACYAVAACGESDWGGKDCTVVSKTNTTVTVSREHSNTLNTYVVIGKQQWGYDTTAFNGSNGRTITFPLSTSATYAVVAIPVTYVSNATGISAITSLTKTSFTIKSNNGVNVTGVRYVAVGKAQVQWGKVTITETVRTYSFPIAFPSACYVCVGIANAQPSGFDWHMNELYMQGSLTGFTTYADIDSTSLVWGFICLGRQQWGRTGSVNGDTTKTITYPIAYTSAFYSIALVSTDNSSDWNAEISGTPGTSTATIMVRGKQRANIYWISVGK